MVEFLKKAMEAAIRLLVPLLLVVENWKVASSEDQRETQLVHQLNGENTLESTLQKVSVTEAESLWYDPVGYTERNVDLPARGGQTENEANTTHRSFAASGSKQSESELQSTAHNLATALEPVVTSAGNTASVEQLVQDVQDEDDALVTSKASQKESPKRFWWKRPLGVATLAALFSWLVITLLPVRNQGILCTPPLTISSLQFCYNVAGV